MKFKKGDLVKVIRKDNRHVLIGSIGKVIHVIPGGVNISYINCTIKQRNLYSFSDNEIELYNSNKELIEDIINE